MNQISGLQTEKKNLPGKSLTLWYHQLKWIIDINNSENTGCFTKNLKAILLYHWQSFQIKNGSNYLGEVQEIHGLFPLFGAFL